MMTFIRGGHLETAYALFGWDMLIIHVEADLRRRSDLAHARRNAGAGI